MYTVTKKYWANFTIEISFLGYVETAKQAMELVYTNLKGNNRDMGVFFGRTKVATIPDIEAHQLLRMICDLSHPRLTTLAVGDENGSTICIEVDRCEQPHFQRCAAIA